MNLLIIDHLAAIIIFEQSFYIFNKQRYLHDKQKPASSLDVALEQYIASPHVGAVREGISAAVQVYEEAVTTATHAYEEAVTTATRAYEEAEKHLPAWIGKLPLQRLQRKAKEAFKRSKEKEKEAFERSKEKEKQTSNRSKAQAKAKLSEAILAITLDHRLCKFHRHVVTVILLICLSSARP
jgi:hypothetical protein